MSNYKGVGSIHIGDEYTTSAKNLLASISFSELIIVNNLKFRTWATCTMHGRVDYNTLSLKYNDLTYYKIFSPCFRTQKFLVIYARLLLSLQKDLIVTYVMSIPVHDIIVISVLKGELIFYDMSLKYKY